MKSALKNIFLLALILILSFGGGFYFGAFPDRILENFGLHHGKVRWICAPEVCPSDAVLLKIQQLTQLQFQMIQTLNTAEDLKASSIRADIIVATRPMLNSIKEELSVFDNVLSNSLLHPDFSSFAEKDRVGLPLFWKITKREKQKDLVRIYSLGFFLESKMSDTQRELLSKTFLNHEVQSMWLKETQTSSTVAELDQDKELNAEQKPSFIRQQSLQDIFIEE